MVRGPGCGVFLLQRCRFTICKMLSKLTLLNYILVGKGWQNIKTLERFFQIEQNWFEIPDVL